MPDLALAVCCGLSDLCIVLYGGVQRGGDGCI
jgi:hypothetical protein